MAESKRTTANEAEEVELEYKRLQIEMLRGQIDERNAMRERVQENRNRQMLDYKKAERERGHKQRVCKHRKGGRNNNFANGNDANYSVITNTYPTGEICITCTRCQKEVWKPKLALKKEDPKLYESMMAEFKEWAGFPTDNTPSGGKIFEITAA